MRLLWTTLGWVGVILGFIGIFLPIWPTVPFLIFAAFCFSRGSPKLHAWLHGLPQVGPLLVAWERSGVIPVYAKVLSTTFLTIGIGYPILYREIPIYLKAMMASVALSVMLYILTRPSKAKSH